MGKPIYRIKVEVIGEEQEGKEVSEALRDGVECNGYVILACKGERGTTAIHGITIIDLAALIARDDEMMGAAIITKALRDSIDIKKQKAESILAGIFGGITK